MSQRFVQNPWLTDVLTTTNATATASTVAAFTPPSNASGVAIVEVLARNTSTNAGAYAEVRRPWQTPGGTTALTGALITALSGAAGALLGDATMTACLVSVVLSGNTVQAQVTGIAATNIEWLISMKFHVN